MDYMLVQQNTIGDVYCQRLNREMDTEKSAGENILLLSLHIHTHLVT